MDLWSRISAIADVASAFSALVALMLVAAGLRSLRTQQTALRISLDLLKVERARDEASSEQDLRRQAQQVSAWWGPLRPESDLSDDADVGAIVFNGSMAPIYHVNIVADHFREDWQAREVWPVVPPLARAKLGVTQQVRPGDVRVELTFMDSAGGHWVRRRHGPLDSLGNRLVIWADSKRRERLGRAIRADFESTYQMRVDFSEIAVDFRFSESRPMDLIGELRAAESAGGRLPDLILVPHDWLGELVAHDVIEPVFMASGQVRSFHTKAMQAMSHGGVAYGIPFFFDSVALLRRDDGLPDKENTLEGHGRVAIQVGTQGDAFQLWPIFSGNGGELFGVDRSGRWTQEVRIDEPVSIRAWHELNRLYRSGALELSRSPDGAIRAFGEGRVSNLFASSSALLKIRKEYPDLKFAVAPLPRLSEYEPRSMCSVYGFLVPRDAENKLLAQAFVSDYLSRFDVGLEWYRLQPSRLPAQKEAYASARQADDPYLRAFETGMLMPAFAPMSRVWDLIGRAQLQVVQAAEKDIDRIVGGLAIDIRSMLADHPAPRTVR